VPQVKRPRAYAWLKEVYNTIPLNSDGKKVKVLIDNAFRKPFFYRRIGEVDSNSNTVFKLEGS
jgi:hypothetical protein